MLFTTEWMDIFSLTNATADEKKTNKQYFAMPWTSNSSLTAFTNISLWKNRAREKRYNYSECCNYALSRRIFETAIKHCTRHQKYSGSDSHQFSGKPVWQWSSIWDILGKIQNPIISSRKNFFFLIYDSKIM